MRVCIFGAGGSFGTAMTRRILTDTDWEIVAFENNEKTIFDYSEKFKTDRIIQKFGDIRDYKAVYDALENVDYVFLASALKHIDYCEKNPDECRKTNIDGCINVINASIDRNVKKLVFLSTDKAVNPTTIYGCSKLFVEMYCKSVDNKNTDIIRTRYGNVFGSNGSVAWIFDKNVKDGVPLTVTNPEMTRFFMSINEAVDLVLTACEFGENGDLWVYNNKSCTIQELADAFSDNQVVVGNRCVEKNDEALLSVSELNHSMDWTNDGKDKYFRVNDKITSLIEYKKPLTSDNAERLSRKEIQDMIDEWRETL